MWIYYNSEGNVSTRIPHGDIIRQQGTLDLYLAFDPSFFDLADNNELYAYLQNEPVRATIHFKQPSQKDFNEFGYIDKNSISIKTFKKLTTSEVTYDLLDGKKYVVLHYHGDSSVTTEFGTHEICVTFYSTNNENENVELVKKTGNTKFYVEKTYGKDLPNTYISPSQYDYLLSIIGDKIGTGDYDIYQLGEHDTVEDVALACIEHRMHNLDSSYIYIAKMPTPGGMSDAICLMFHDASSFKPMVLWGNSIYSFEFRERELRHIKTQIDDLNVQRMAVRYKLEVPTPSEDSDAVNKKFADETYANKEETLSELETKANDDEVVHLEGEETIEGKKRFLNGAEVPTIPSSDYDAINAGYADGRYANKETTTEKLNQKVDKIEGKGLSTNDYTDIDKGKVNLLEEIYATKQEIPTKLSQFNNDTGFITNTVNNLYNYYLKSETYSKDEITKIVNSISTLTLKKVDKLPIEKISTSTIYLVKAEDQDEKNIYEEYVYVDGNWEIIGTTEVDLSNFYTKDEIEVKLSNYLGKNEAAVDSLKLGGFAPEYYLDHDNLINAPQKINIVAREEPSPDTVNSLRELEIFGDKWKISNVSKTSELENDSGFVNREETIEYIENNSTLVSTMEIATSESGDYNSDNELITSAAVNKLINEAIGDINTLLDTINGEVI